MKKNIFEEKSEFKCDLKAFSFFFTAYLLLLIFFSEGLITFL